MTLLESLRKAQIFAGLSAEELERFAALSQQRTYSQGEKILGEGESTRELFIVGDGMVQVSLRMAGASTPLANLGQGQIFGEMALVDHGARSATVEAIKDGTRVHVIPHDAFLRTCEEDNHIGYIVMRNLAAEMSLKLRFQNITGQINAGE